MNERAFSRDQGETYAPTPDWALPADEWRRLLEDEAGPLRPVLSENYGEDSAVLRARRSLYLAVVSRFIDAWGGERPVYLIASPCRINWEGHHVDHQGGSYNATTHAREMVAVCARREDREVTAANIAESFPASRFRLDDAEPCRDPSLRWSDYLKGGLLAVGKRLGGSPVGADLVVGGDIPIGAGLSSSHALVLCGVLAGLAVNGGDLPKREAVAGVQEGEWFTGSRTGLGDQATMIFGGRDRLFFGRVLVADEIAPRYASLPSDVLGVMINSYAEHSLHGKEKLGYNRRVFAYRVAFPLLMAALEECGATKAELGSVKCLADISPRHLPTEMIYRALRSIPDILPLEEIRRRLGARRSGIDLDGLIRTYFGNGGAPAEIRMRGIALYGLAECGRSALFGPLVQDGRMGEACQLMTVGHHGDRVFERDRSGSYRRVHDGISDAALDRLIADRLSGDPDRVARAALAHQPGEYRASTRELDLLVDSALESGALGASLTGGGLGGAVVCFIERARLLALWRAVLEYYQREEQAEAEWIMENEESAQLSPADEADRIRGLVASAWARKREAYADRRTWAPDPHETAALNRIRRRLAEQEAETDAEPARRLRYLPVDWASEGIQENVSVAGAGYLIPPASPAGR